MLALTLMLSVLHFHIEDARNAAFIHSNMRLLNACSRSLARSLIGACRTCVLLGAHANVSPRQPRTKRE